MTYLRSIGFTDSAVNTQRVVDEAADLLTQPGDSNPEYDRALVELTCRVLGLDTNSHRESLAGYLSRNRPV